MIAKKKFYSVEHLEDTLQLITEEFYRVSHELQAVKRALVGKKNLIRNPSQIDENNRIPLLEAQQQFDTYCEVRRINYILLGELTSLQEAISEIENRD